MTLGSSQELWRSTSSESAGDADIGFGYWAERISRSTSVDRSASEELCELRARSGLLVNVFGAPCDRGLVRGAEFLCAGRGEVHGARSAVLRSCALCKARNRFQEDHLDWLGWRRRSILIFCNKPRARLIRPWPIMEGMMIVIVIV